MKQVLMLFFSLLAFFPAYSQQQLPAAAAEAAQQDAKQLIAKYELNEQQAAEMLKIQQRKQRTLLELDTFKTADPALYRAKLASLQNGTLASIRRVLTTETQVSLYQKTRTELRTQRAEKRKEMMLAGATPEAVEDAVLTVYFE